MADKSTVTLYPAEYGEEPHIPIEVDPNQVEMMRQKGWRTTEEMGLAPPEPDTARNRKRKKKKESSPPAVE